MNPTKRSKRPVVMASLENGDGTRCVDIFLRPNGTFGFEEYRRDPEDPRGWSGAAGFAGRVFDDQKAARFAAGNAVQWLGADPSE